MGKFYPGSDEIGPDGDTAGEAIDDIANNLVSAGFGPTNPNRARKIWRTVDRIRVVRWQFMQAVYDLGFKWYDERRRQNAPQ